MITIARSETARERFNEKWIPEPNTGCWLWIGGLNSGYGQLRVGTMGIMKAHRVSYELHVGPIPPGLLICHRCDTPPYVNPDHLYAGTHRMNAADMMRRGRDRFYVGGPTWTGPHSSVERMRRYRARLSATP